MKYHRWTTNNSAAYQHDIHTSALGVSVPVFCFSSVLQASTSASCLGVLDPLGLGDLLSGGLEAAEAAEAAAGGEDVLNMGLSFFTNPNYPI